MDEEEKKELAEIDETVKFCEDEVAWYERGLEDTKRGLEQAKKARAEYIALCEGG